MKKYFNKYLIFFIILIVALTVWFEINKMGSNETPNPVLPEAKISALPEDLEKSVAGIIERAGEKKRENGSGIFNILKKDNISADTPLVLQTYYKKSDEMTEYVTGMPASFSGLTIKQLESTLRDWDIREYQPKNALILRRTKDELSPEDKSKQHLGIKNGRVVIFYGNNDSEGKKVVKQKTSIKAEDLPESERAKLEKGINIKSEEELFTILEGLLSYKQD